MAIHEELESRRLTSVSKLEAAVQGYEPNRFLPAYIELLGWGFDAPEWKSLLELDNYAFEKIGHLKRTTGGHMPRHWQSTGSIYLGTSRVLDRRPYWIVAATATLHDTIEDDAETINWLKELKEVNRELEGINTPTYLLKHWEERPVREAELEGKKAELQTQLDERRTHNLNEVKEVVYESIRKSRSQRFRAFAEEYSQTVGSSMTKLTRLPESEGYLVSATRVITPEEGDSLVDLIDTDAVRTADRIHNTVDRGNRAGRFSGYFNQFFGSNLHFEDLYANGGDKRDMNNSDILVNIARTIGILNIGNLLLTNFARDRHQYNLVEESTIREHLIPLVGALNIEGSRSSMVRFRSGLLGLLAHVGIDACMDVYQDLEKKVGRDYVTYVNRQIEIDKEKGFFEGVTFEPLGREQRSVLAYMFRIDSFPKNGQELDRLEKDPKRMYFIARYLEGGLEKLNEPGQPFVYRDLVGPRITATMLE